MRYKKLIPVIFLVAVIAFSAAMILSEQLGRKQEADDFDALAKIVGQDTAEEPASSGATASDEPEKSAEKKKSYEELYALNHDFIGWIRIGGTKINYPVMQTKTDPEYYLRRNFYKQRSQSGVPFADARCNVGVSDNVILYGHNMRSRTMFGDLRNYRKKSYWREHPVIHFDTLAQSGRYEIMAVLITTTEKKNDPYSVYRFIRAADKTDFDGFISAVKKQSLYETGVTAEYNDKLLTLSTCNKSNSSERLVVVAREKAPELTPSNDFD